VLALLKEAKNGETAEQIVRRKCRTIVASAKESGWEGPPFCPFELASLLGAKIKAVTHDIRAEARIFGKMGQVFIEYRKDIVLPERLRFSICHELAHTVFPDCYERVRHLNGAITTPDEKEFEHLCDIGAGEFLLPLEEFTKDLNAMPLTLEHVVFLKEAYLASIEATIRRSLDLTQRPHAAVFFHHAIDGKDEASRDELAVKYFCRSASFRRFFIAPGSYPPKSSTVNMIPLSNGDNTQPTPIQLETWGENVKSTRLHVQAIALPKVPQKTDYPKVMALVTPL